MDSPKDSKVTSAQWLANFERPPEHLVKQAQEQIEAGKRQIREMRERNQVRPDAEEYLTDPEEQGDE